MSAPVTATTVEADCRLDFLPRRLGRHCVTFETFAFALMDRACESYSGGFWTFRELSNGGFYMAPDMPGKLRLVWPDNYFDGEMSADAAGIAVSLFALSHLSFEAGSEAIAEKYHRLRDYSLDHAEAARIFGFID